MFSFSNIEDLVRSRVNFSYGVAANGWNRTFCEVCGDGSRVKGPRGGWLFTEGGSACSYHCFNCGEKGTFDISRETPTSKKMHGIFAAFGITESEYKTLIMLHKKQDGTVKKDKPKSKAFSHTFLEMPSYWHSIDGSEPEAKSCREFIKSKYGLTKNDYTFYTSNGYSVGGTPKDASISAGLRNRVIVPYFKNGKMIYYQGRDITGKAKMKYLSPELPKGNILFNWDSIFLDTKDPLYIVESAFDAIHLGGTATMENDISAMQLEALGKCRREKIVVPDFNGDSFNMAKIAIQHGWNVAFPNYRKTCKDVSEAVVKYGKLYTFYDIASNVKYGHEAEFMLRFLLSSKTNHERNK